MLAVGPRPVYSQEGCEIDLNRRELRILGSVAPLGGRAFQIVEILVESAGELITKNALMECIWPGAVFSDNRLAVHAAALRKALGPYRDFLKTEAGRGYRLLGDWTAVRPGQDGASRTAAPPLLTDRPPSNNLPVFASDLVGRTADLDNICNLLSAYRLVTLTGPGGIGKTRAAIETARLLLSEYQGEVYLVELGSLVDASLIASAVASAGIGFSDTDMTPLALARAIGERKVLIVFDNCEHLIDAVARMLEMLMRLCPGASLLTTSRELMRIEGEYAYRIPPLHLPPVDGPALEEERLREISAVQLFSCG
jgi:non-specific serine/threonine protein kinase